MLPQQVEQSAESCHIGKIQIWVKGFIPGEVGELVRPIPGAAGQTMVDVPTLPGCFSTDNRSFSNDLHASARMTSLLEIDLRQTSWNEKHWCDATRKLNCTTGAVEDEKVGTIHGSYELVRRFEWKEGTAWMFTLRADAANPCTPPGSPASDYNARITVAVNKHGDRARIWVHGLVDAYPAVEMYARADDGPAHIVFQQNLAAGKGPWNLYGDANVPVNGDVSLRKRCGYQIRHREEWETSNAGVADDLTAEVFVWPDDSATSGWGAQGTVAGTMTLIEVGRHDTGETYIKSSRQIQPQAEVNLCAMLHHNDGYLVYGLYSEPIPAEKGYGVGGGGPSGDGPNGRRIPLLTLPLEFPRDAQSGHWVQHSGNNTYAGFGSTVVKSTIDIARRRLLDAEPPDPSELEPGAPTEQPPPVIGTV